MNALTSKHLLPTSLGRVIAVALVALTLMLVSVDISVAVLDEGTPSISVTAEPVPSARDDCRAGRRRTGTSALRLGVDPAPNCGALLAHSDDIVGRGSPGVQP